MTPAGLAALHHAATGAGWSETDFAGFLDDPKCALAADGHSFALGRVTLDEAELLMLATHPGQRRRGSGRARLTEFESLAFGKGATQVFLEVADQNHAARNLYATSGYAEIGRRKAYYRTGPDAGQDAIIMRKFLTKWSKFD